MADRLILDYAELQTLFDHLASAGYQIVAPALEDGAISYRPLQRVDQLPAGQIDQQGPGHYRLHQDDAQPQRLFGYTTGANTWKHYLYPPTQKLWHAERRKKGFRVVPAEPTETRFAFIGVRACELAAINIQDRVFDNPDVSDSSYTRRRADALIVAVNCTRATDSCFCVSMGSGPAVESGYDLLLTELIDDRGHRFLLQSGSKRGRKLLKGVSTRDAEESDTQLAEQLVAAAAGQMGRSLAADAAELLRENADHPHWEAVAGRCLNCANCTLACPTCFCSTSEQRTSLDGSVAEQWRRWDSCFTVEFSYIHGGPVRQSGSARYRHWITHKLANWQQQFGTAGCTGCGHCITWCPVGIDITAEVEALRSRDPDQHEGEE